MRRTLGGLLRSRSPSWRLVTVGRILHEQPADDGDDEISDAEICERGQNSDRLNQPSRHRRGNECARAKSADSNSGDEPALIGKPFHQHRHRNDVAETEPESSDESVTKIEPPKFVRGKARKENAKSVKKRAGQRDDARPFPRHPQSAKERGKSQNENADGKRQRYFRDAPAELLRQRHTENTPRVDRAERDLEEHAGNRNRPAIRCFHFTPKASLRHPASESHRMS